MRADVRLSHALDVANDREPLAAIRRARRRLADHGPEATGDEGHVERVSLPKEDCDVLRDLVVSERAQSVIEIGLAYGSSALAIAEALTAGERPDAKHLITAVSYFEVNTGWLPQATPQPTRLHASRLPDPRTEPSFESFRPFGVAATP